MTKKPSTFRIYAKKLLLTYSQVNPEMTHEHLLEQLKHKLPFDDIQYVIAREQHQDGGIHYHVILAHFDKFQIRHSNQLDIQFENQTFHGSYTSIRRLHSAVSYACKENHYITNFENLSNGRLLTAKEFIIQEVKNKGIEQALIDYYDRAPNQAIAGLSIQALNKHFKEIERLKLTLQLETVETPFTLDSFKVQPELAEWMNKPNKTLVLVGSSGIGKTQFCKAYVKHNKLKTLMISHKEDFRRLNTSYDAIIIDDANIHELEETQLLSIIDNQADKTIRVLYDSVIKKAGLIQLIAMNQSEFGKLAYTLSQDRFARRVLLHEAQKPFIVNVNIQNNIVNNHFNITSQSFQQHQEDEQQHILRTQQLIQNILQKPIL